MISISAAAPWLCNVLNNKNIFDNKPKIFAAPPGWVTMSVSGDHAQPVAAGTSVHVSCSSGGGKPVPSFRWRVGDTEVEEHTETLGADLEVTSEITIDVEEEHDGAEIQCW